MESQENPLALMQDIQKECGYIPRGRLESMSADLHIPMSELYSIVTFYKALTLTPRGRHTIKMCSGTACHIKGGRNLRGDLERLLGVGPGATTADMMFTLEIVNCLGACAVAPVMLIDGTYYGKLTTRKLESILEKYKTEKAV
ncbi:MAG: NAD(P)H-dependent oxidoreductase subunit E [Clostridiales bacterium]|nr:NAD(P)H-dependent oxidoreductase subunit E [Clostridiales bacterium]